MGEPRITILMPVKTYHPAFFAQALDSVFAQTSPRWRLAIVVEAEDRERFRDLLARELADPRASLVVNEGRKLAGAFNTGMRHATTDFVAILLADDLWAPEAVAVLERAIDRYPAAEFFHSARRIVDDRGVPISPLYPARETFTLDDFVDECPVKHLLCWSRRRALAIGGMDESLNSVGPDDFDFPWSMAEAGVVFQAVPECLYVYRDHRECYRLTTHLPLTVHVSEIRRIMQKHGAAPARVRRRIRFARHSYLRQCLFRSGALRWLKQWWGYDARRGWRETYR